MVYWVRSTVSTLEIFDHDKENLLCFALGLVTVSPCEMWNEKILSRILKPNGRLFKLDKDFEEVSKGQFVKVCLELDVSRPLKMKINYQWDDSLYECLVDCENITNICYGDGSHNHKFDTCSFNSKV